MCDHPDAHTPVIRDFSVWARHAAKLAEQNDVVNTLTLKSVLKEVKRDGYGKERNDVSCTVSAIF